MLAVESLWQEAHNFNVSEIAYTVLNDHRFTIWTGSGESFSHHYGKGGLAQHTLEVVQLCLTNNLSLGVKLDQKKIYLAALFHDVGKIWDYEPTDAEYQNWQCAKHKKTIHHISRSAIIWSEAVKKANWAEPDIDDVLHAILAHHCMPDWGSPVMPRTRLAWLLHLCDALSARMDDCDRRTKF